MPAAVAAAVLLVGGCGGGGAGGGGGASAGGSGGMEGHGAGPMTSTASPAAAHGIVLSVTGTEYSFAPTALRAAAGRTTIRFTNNGAAEHDFVIKTLGVHLVAQPGKTAEATVTLKAGTYKSYCSVPGHSQSGMQGTLTVS